MTDGGGPHAGGAWQDYATPEAVPLVLDADDRSRAIVGMLSTGAFADTPALARWSATAEAQPILREFLLARIRPAESDYFAIDLDAAAGEIDAQDALAADIEARFGQ